MNDGSDTTQALERLVFEIAQGVSGETGEGFFRSLVRHLARVLDAEFVLAGVLKPGQDRIATLAAYANGAEAPPFEYDLAGTPCANVIGQQICSYPDDIQHLFPQDHLLVDMGAVGYVGSPIVDSSGRALGLLCAITKKPLPNPKLAQNLLQIFVTRAAAELERKNHEEELTASEQRLRALVDHGNEAVIRVEVEPPFSIDLPEDEQIDLLYRHAYIADSNEQAAALFGFQTAADMIGKSLERVTGRSDEQNERLKAGIRVGWQFSQVERTLEGRTFLLTRQGNIENGKLTGGWVTARDVTPLKDAEGEVYRLNRELKHRVEELTELKARLEQDKAYLLDEIDSDQHFEELTGSSAPFRELTESIRRVAPTSATVLIFGETGTGKELVARAIHKLSPRRDRPLVKVNCAAISAGLVESELFGHVKGAFTGATDHRIGRFEYANGGTIFLDEISELPAESQSKLLRVLQEQEFEPVGSNRTIKVDVRVLAASNRKLAEFVREGRFRMDLYYRLMVVPVDVPALRDRREDIPALTAALLIRLNSQFGRRVKGVSEGMMKRLVDYDWPGNVRELENFLARAVVLCQDEILDAPLEQALPPAAPATTALTLEEAERQHIGSILVRTRWVVEGPRGAAEILKMNPSTLRSRMKRLGIHRPS